MRVLVACEESQVVTIAFRERGHEAYSCDLLPCSGGHPEWHLQQDVIPLLAEKWDLMIAHPPCTYLSRAGARWWKNPERQKLADRAAEFVFILRDASINRICIENPIGQLNTRWRRPDQTIQPWEFGHPFSKATCLWLKNLPPLFATLVCNEYEPLLPSNTGWGAKRGQKHHRGVTRNAKIASRTFPGIAKAMAEQWG